MLEVEVKYRNADRTAAVATLLEWGATLAQDRTDLDLYFQAPDRDLKASDEAFRLRRIGPKNCLTYKGPRRDTETKTRPEIEVPLGDGDTAAADMQRLLVALGYAPVTTVKKKRRVYQFARDGFDLEACFDTVDGVGAFVELEILADEAQYDAAKTVLLAAAAELGLTEQEPRSYLSMVLQAQGSPLA
ncbi:class IV adenylate cyclase [Gemmata sp. JC717]|uniref:Class IV adenylate cyclase n=1 Tax=Gemmata algarum TaxID=2975278 RepID=A0ABU5ETA2_9BACT|nr:class IV adenylate cyclase [Gemmata algarum]MDY3552628.1 class IV adenylate cyclase [Gemmata algarum]MDY3557700.1 class IV adenylate cyclase [Gemmata algarum]